MRFITTTLLSLLVSLQVMAGKVIKNPVIEYSASWMEITEIELTKEATIVRGVLRQGSSILNNTVLADRNTGKEFKFLRVEGVKAQERATADGTPCTIYFEPLDASVKEFNYIEVGIIHWETTMASGCSQRQRPLKSQRCSTQNHLISTTI